MSSRPSWLNHAISPDDLAHGDHIYCYRGPFYKHHGIYDAHRNKVIHVVRFGASTLDMLTQPISDKVAVKITTLERFLQGSTLRLYVYGASSLAYAAKSNGTCATEMCGAEIGRAVDIASWFTDHPGAFGNFDLMRWNCECFAKMCKTARFTADDLGVQNEENADIGEFVRRASDWRTARVARFNLFGNLLSGVTYLLRVVAAPAQRSGSALPCVPRPQTRGETGNSTR